MVRRVTDRVQCAFFKIPKANDISEMKLVFLLHYSVKHCKALQTHHNS